MNSRPMVDRFWEKVEKTSNCWTWKAALAHDYGRFWDGKRMRMAHHVSYELCVGKIAKSDLHHKCRNKSCVNPDHLEPLTRVEHVQMSYSFASTQKKQTHCKRGHKLTGKNLKVRTRGNGVLRDCRECLRLRQKKYNNSEKGRATHRRHRKTDSK